MRVKKRILVLVICVCCSGCSPGREVWNWSILRTLRYEAKYHRSEHHITRHEYQLADQAWNSYRELRPEEDSPDFARGFRDGYAGFLHTGHLEPPSAPPERYRWFRRDGPTGYRAAEDWFAGYRIGAIEAANSGYRESLIVPTSSLYCGPLETGYSASPTVQPPEMILAPEPTQPEILLPDELLFQDLLLEDVPTRKVIPGGSQSRGSAARHATANTERQRDSRRDANRSSAPRLTGVDPMPAARKTIFRDLVPEIEETDEVESFEPIR